MDKQKSSHESLQEQLDAQQEALVKIYSSVEKTRKMIFWSGIINLAIFILPLIAVVFLLPMILSSFTGSLGGLTESGIGISVDAITEPSLRESLQSLQELAF